MNFQQKHNSGNKRFNGERKMFYRTYCSNSGHIIERCYKKIHGYPPNHKFKGKTGGNFGTTCSGGFGNASNGYNQMTNVGNHSFPKSVATVNMVANGGLPVLS